MLAEFPQKEKDIKGAFDELKRNCFRGLIIQRERRIDGRGLKDIRPITCEVEILPRTHGSALFTRGGDPGAGCDDTRDGIGRTEDRRINRRTL